MKILVVLINRGNYVSRYFLRLVDMLNGISKLEGFGVEADLIVLGDYLDVNQDAYDVLIYNTFPDEESWKFDREYTLKCDDKFHSFTGTKILLDTHDNGTRDGFSRFNDFSTPRIKANPSYAMVEKMNLIMSVPYVVYPAFRHPQKERPYTVVCAMRIKGMPENRQRTFDAIQKFNPISGRLSITQHARRLCKTLINIVPTGRGDSSRSHTDTLAAGAMLMAEEDIRDIKLLPHVDLQDGEHFVSYTVDTICSKLEYLLSNVSLIDEIRRAGMSAFKAGYDCRKSANGLLQWVKVNV